MKNFVCLTVMLASLCLQAQTNAPNPKWITHDWALIEPSTEYDQVKNESGEDWWYDHENVFDAGGNHTGYIACGYSQGLNRVGTNIDQMGCYQCDESQRQPNPAKL